MNIALHHTDEQARDEAQKAFDYYCTPSEYREWRGYFRRGPSVVRVPTMASALGLYRFAFPVEIEAGGIQLFQSPKTGPSLVSRHLSVASLAIALAAAPRMAGGEDGYLVELDEETCHLQVKLVDGYLELSTEENTTILRAAQEEFHASVASFAREVRGLISKYLPSWSDDPEVGPWLSGEVMFTEGLLNNVGLTMADVAEH